MRNNILILLCTCFIGLKCLGQEAGNYLIIINNDTISLDLNKETEYKTKKGEKLSIVLTQPKLLTYVDEMISFKYPKSSSVSNTVIEDGIEQCMVMKSSGNGFIVQKYSTIDPSSLTSLMLNEITKESISYGYTKAEKEFTKKLVSGQEIKGIQSTLTYKGESEVYTVATYGGRDEGIIVITMVMGEEFADKDLIDLFLNTLSYNK